MSSGRRTALLAAVLLCATIISLGLVLQERRYARQMAADNQQMSAMLDQTRSQVEALAKKLDAISVQPPPSPVATSTPAPTRGGGHVAAKRRPRVVEDRRWNTMQKQLAEQQKQIRVTQEDVATTRSDLETSVRSARDELGGSIARNHEELVALEKKGERNYYEFDLTKSKEFQRAGPISLSLRKTNTKRDYYDLAMLVDDFQLGKKHVNLYEPVLIYPADSRQPLELVVNRIDKNEVHGYVSEPKYKQTESAASGSSTGGSSSTSKTASSTGPQPAPTSEADASLEHRSEPPQF